MLTQVLIYTSLLVTVAVAGSKSLLPSEAPGPENKCCYRELNKFVENGLDSPKFFKALVHPRHATCPPHGLEHPKHNWNLANLTKCLSYCQSMYDGRFELHYAKHLVNALRFTMLMCQKKFDKVENFLHTISYDTEDKCQEKTKAMVSSIHNVYITWENFEDTCKTRIDALECMKLSQKHGSSILQDVELYLYGLLATVYNILEAQEAANNEPHNHTIPSGAEACKIAINDTMNYLEANATVPGVSWPTASTVIEPGPSNNSETTKETTKGDSPGSTNLSTVNVTDANNTSSTVALPPGPSAQSSVLPPNATENFGNSNKCFYNFDRLTIVMALTIVLGVSLPMAMDSY
ncbi:hypothetical protein DdX_11108 [Ditylenchus destructor]|uniref:Uncharacterized protein n=1 Tax=Ditylenchus destructor TaxID=166010 RepID=A0AAD4N1C4_9BILA|nr:hypothetical protein DdX_11108 [Ditylenchus destructor]